VGRSLQLTSGRRQADALGLNDRCLSEFVDRLSLRQRFPAPLEKLDAVRG
jgi:hypothetical protein